MCAFLLQWLRLTLVVLIDSKIITVFFFFYWNNYYSIVYTCEWLDQCFHCNWPEIKLGKLTYVAYDVNETKSFVFKGIQILYYTLIQKKKVEIDQGAFMTYLQITSLFMFLNNYGVLNNTR